MSGDAADLPRFGELPLRSDGTPTAWGVFGEHDSLGTANTLSAAAVVAAAHLVRSGKVFALDAPLDTLQPPLVRHRSPPRHSVFSPGNPLVLDDVVDNFFPQGVSQWDSLAHCARAEGEFYNGASLGDVRNGANCIHHLAALGLAGRGVLLDVERLFEARGEEYAPWLPIPLGPTELEWACTSAGIELEAGDVLMLRTGFLGWYRSLTMERRRELSSGYSHPGLAHSAEVCEYLWDAHVAAVVSDTAALEAWPAESSSVGGPYAFLHRILIGELGMMLGELWQLDELAADCAADGVHEFLVVSAPMNLTGGIGSPANAVAIK